MKLKDLLNTSWDLKTRILIGRRLLNCSNLMKKEIVEWKRTGEIPEREFMFQLEGNEFIISINDLITTYGMDPLSAMLFFDDLIKANKMEDKTRLINLIERLRSGKRKKPLVMTQDMLTEIRTNQPNLWNEYERLKKTIETENSMSGEEWEKIENTEIQDEN